MKKSSLIISSKDKSKKLKWCLLQFLFGALRVNLVMAGFVHFLHFIKLKTFDVHKLEEIKKA